MENKLMEVNGTKYAVPIDFNRKHLEILTLIFPEPIGYGLSIVDACKVLKIHPQSGYRRIATIKHKFPKIIQILKESKHCKSRQQNSIRKPKSLGFGYFDYDLGEWTGDKAEWLEGESNDTHPSEAAKRFGLIVEWF
ncbi:MAG: hypothetical protein ACFFDN_24415 [Candidatus Hodarchaeota archaeon]